MEDKGGRMYNGGVLEASRQKRRGLVDWGLSETSNCFKGKVLSCTS